MFGFDMTNRPDPLTPEQIAAQDFLRQVGEGLQEKAPDLAGAFTAAADAKPWTLKDYIESLCDDASAT